MSTKNNIIGTLPIISKIHGNVFSQLRIQSLIYFLLKDLTPLNYIDLNFMYTHPISVTNQIGTHRYHKFKHKKKLYHNIIINKVVKSHHQLGL